MNDIDDSDIYAALKKSFDEIHKLCVQQLIVIVVLFSILILLVSILVKYII